MSLYNAMKIVKVQEARAEAALDVMVRHNGAARLVSRRSIVETKVAAGARVVLRKTGERVLMSPDGAFLDAKNITKAGLDYAERLQAGR